MRKLKETKDHLKECTDANSCCVILTVICCFASMMYQCMSVVVIAGRCFSVSLKNTARFQKCLMTPYCFQNKSKKVIKRRLHLFSLCDSCNCWTKQIFAKIHSRYSIKELLPNHICFSTFGKSLQQNIAVFTAMLLAFVNQSANEVSDAE